MVELKTRSLREFQEQIKDLPRNSPNRWRPNKYIHIHVMFPNIVGAVVSGSWFRYGEVIAFNRVTRLIACRWRRGEVTYEPLDDYIVMWGD